MTNGNKGPIGLPLRRVQSRNALAMSAIQEEHSSLETLIPVAISASNSCSTSPTPSSSSSDSSPNQQRANRSLQSRPIPRATRQRMNRSRSVAKFETVETTSSPVSKSQTPTRAQRDQSARTRTIPSITDASMAGVKGLTAVVTKHTKSRSSRFRSVPCFEESKESPESKPNKAAKSLRSRPLSCFENLLSSGPAPQTEREGWKPRAIGTRPASRPTSLMPRSKSSATLTQLSSLPASSNKPKRSVRRDSNPPLRSTTKPSRMARPHSSTNLVSTVSSKPAKQSCRRFPSEEETSVNRPRASSDGGQGQKEALSLTAEAFRPRSSSDSASSKRPIKPSSRPRHFEGKFQNRRDQSLLYFSLFPPEKMAMRGIILHLHGMGDHCRRNTELYERYCKNGFGVIAYDLLNHGASAYDKYNTRAHISNFDDFVDDTNDFITFAKLNIYKVALRYWRKHHHPRHPHGKEKKRESLSELPLIITGTSFGSLIGLHTVLSGEHKFHAAVWASPSIGVTWTPVLWAQWKFAKPLVAAFPTAKMIPAIQHNLRSRNPEFLTKYQEDPLTSSDMITPRSGHQSLHAMIRLQQDKRISDTETSFCAIPMLFLAGSDDRISDQQASLKFFSQMGNLDKEFKFFDGLYHMIYEEPEKEDVLTYLMSWLHKRFPLKTRQPNDSHLNVLKKLEPSLRSYKYGKAKRTEL